MSVIKTQFIRIKRPLLGYSLTSDIRNNLLNNVYYFPKFVKSLGWVGKTL